MRKDEHEKCRKAKRVETEKEGTEKAKIIQNPKRGCTQRQPRDIPHDRRKARISGEGKRGRRGRSAQGNRTGINDGPKLDYAERDRRHWVL